MKQTARTLTLPLMLLVSIAIAGLAGGCENMSTSRRAP